MKELQIMTVEDKRRLLKSLIVKELGGVKSFNNEENTQNQVLQEQGVNDTIYSIKEINKILIKKISKILKIPQNKIELANDLSLYGLDSMGTVVLLRQINTAFSTDIDAQEIVFFKNIQEMSNFIFEFLKTNTNGKHTKGNNLSTNFSGVSLPTNSNKKEDSEPITLASFEIIGNRDDHEITLLNNLLNENDDATFARKTAVGSTVTLAENDTSLINFLNFDYLGYGTHPKVIASVKSSIETYGLGASASPLGGGRLTSHDELENELLSFYGKKDSRITLFSTGYNAVFGSISAYMKKGDHIVLDVSSHASMIDGATFSQATLHYYAHNDLEDLEAVLKAIDNGVNRILVCTEGVFSIDGDYGDIKGVVRVSKKYGAKVFVDEAHSALLAGDKGKGVCYSQGVLDEVDLLIGTLSKTFPGVGGYLLANKAVSKYIDLFARNRMFSTALPPTIVAGAIATLKLARSKDGDQRRKKLLNNCKVFRSLCQGKLPLFNSETWIFSIIFGNEDLVFKIADYLMKNGVLVSPVCYPVVPRGFARIRHFLSCEHTVEQLKETVRLTVEAAEKFGYNKKEF